MGRFHTARFIMLLHALPLLPFYLKQIFKLVDAEAELCHAGFEELPQPVLLHETNKNTEGLLLWHLGGGERIG